MTRHAWETPAGTTTRTGHSVADSGLDSVQKDLMDRTLDHASLHTRPAGKPVMHQTWSKLLFMHWQVPAAMLRPLVASRLSIDTYDGTAWIGVTPFTMPRFRPALFPALPGLSSTHELNVRTYVHYEGVPGVWFFSLDAANPIAVLGARLAFGLPYYQARMALDERDRTIRYTSRRIHPGAPTATFEATWSREEALPEARTGSLEDFLIERYCLYVTRGTRLYRTRIHHLPWPLCRVTLHDYTSTMVESHGLPSPSGPLLLHGLAAPLQVDVWRPSRV